MIKSKGVFSTERFKVDSVAEILTILVEDLELTEEQSNDIIVKIILLLIDYKIEYIE